MQQDKSIAPTAIYFLKVMGMKDTLLARFQSNHIMILYFCVHGLDILGKLSPNQRQATKKYALSLQRPAGGWLPSSFYTQFTEQDNPFSLPHVVFTYSALNILHITGGLGQINKEACLESVRRCYKPNGSYSSFQNSQQADLRFVYAAMAIHHLLDDFTGVNKQQIIEYINSCKNFDGGYGLRPNCQSHSGAIYCALAALKLLNAQPQQKSKTLNFLVNRQVEDQNNQNLIGIQGRVGKIPDSCYSFWVGASIKILTDKNLLNPKVQNFLKACHKADGGYSKYSTDQRGDPVHTIHSTVGRKIVRNESNQLELEKGVKKH